MVVVPGTDSGGAGRWVMLTAMPGPLRSHDIIDHHPRSEYVALVYGLGLMRQVIRQVDADGRLNTPHRFVRRRHHSGDTSVPAARYRASSGTCLAPPGHGGCYSRFKLLNGSFAAAQCPIDQSTHRLLAHPHLGRTSTVFLIFQTAFPEDRADRASAEGSPAACIVAVGHWRWFPQTSGEYGSSFCHQAAALWR